MAHIDLMEAAEANAVVGAILWLAQTIMETLQPGVLDAWLHRVGLAGAIGELKSEVERMETVVNGVRGRAVGNKPLTRSLARVKELVYDADDVVDELDYYRLQQQVEGVMLAPAIEPEAEGMVGDGKGHVDASGSTAAIPDNDGRKNRSKERDYFHITPAVNGEPAKAKCIDCGTEVLWGHGTSVLRKHRNSARCKNNKRTAEMAPNCPSASDNVQNGSIISTISFKARKRIRTEGNVITPATPWDKAKFSERIHEIAVELGSIRGYVIEYLKDSVASSDQSNTTSDTRVRTSGSLPGKIYGRDVEKKWIMSLIEAAKSDKITVLPIVGIVGVGKTALAKLVYNDQFVKDQFERIWVWVSNIFDEVRVTREILDVVILNSHEGSPHDRESYGVRNYAKLQEVLKTCMAPQLKKIFLVLDDVNDYMGGSRWKDLLDALGSSCTKGNMIIVTTRDLSIAQRLGTVEPVKLGALEDDDFWLLFKACAVDYNNCKEHLDYEEHLEIGSQIAEKLKGNPLAAESVTEMLREQPTLGHWKNIVRNGVWESLQLHGGIVTTLKNSYHQLSYQLQQCFLLCSIFPYNHPFHIDDLVCMWISLGFVKSMKIGQDYFNALVNSCLLEQVSIKNDIVLEKECYVMCGMMHEFARLVSRTEFATIDGLECKEVLPTVRHLSIQTDLLYHVDECGKIICNVKLEEKLQSLVSPVKRLRMLILIGNYDPLFLQSFYTFMCNSVNCTHLRYLKLDNKESSDTLCISLSKFYHLEVLHAGCRAIVHDMSDLISMRHLVLTKGACGTSSPSWSASLQTVHLEDCEGWEIPPSLESLSSLTKLKLRNMARVTKLLIPSLEELVLIDMPKLDRCLTNSVRNLNSSLRVLEIRRCPVLKTFPLFESCEKIKIDQNSWLPNVSELTIHECPHLMVSNPLPPLGRFCKVSVTKVALCSSAASTSGRRPASATPASQSLLSQLYRHSVEIDLLLRIEAERHARAILSLVERAAARRLRAAEAGLERARACKAELDERLGQMEGEGQVWQGIIKCHMDVVAGLRATLDVVLTQKQFPLAGTGAGEGDAEARRLRPAEAGLEPALSCNAELDELDEWLRQMEREGQASPPAGSGTGAGEGDSEDAEQEHGAEASGGRTRACRGCGEAEACVLLLPCRHLCLCGGCDAGAAGVQACPVCACTKRASIHVLLS